MNLKFYSVLFVWLVISTNSFAQTPAYEYFITVNGNLYMPRNNPEKGMYPILGYDKKTDAKLLIGGVGAGLSVFKPVKSKVSLKGQANLSKHTYWDGPSVFTDAFGNPVGDLSSASSDYALGITATAHYFLSKKISVGTGLGAQLLLVSLSRSPKINDVKSKVWLNRYYKPVMPTLPLELSFKSNQKLINIRYEHGLLNRYRNELQNAKTDKFGLLTFELGFKIKR